MSQAVNNLVAQALQKNSGQHDSWSLFFDKFSGYSSKKEPILKNAINWYKKEKSQKQLEQSIEQKYALFANLAKTKKVVFVYLENRSRLLVNMGHSCVLESVGFSFERISGLPYVPGTALKGVVSNWAIWEANGDAAFEENLPNFKNERSVLDQELVDIFGANDGDAQQGKVNFYGIFPLEVPKLKIDILTPHQGRIVPNHFITVDAGTKWMIPIALNRGDESLLAKAGTLIEECLCNYGVGAKTASGYGKFDFITPDDLETIKNSFEEKVNRQEKARKEAEAAVRLAKEKAEADRLALEKKQKAEEDARIAEETRRNEMSTEDLAYEDYCKKVTDWIGEARDVLSKSDDDKTQILRFFRSQEGQQLLAGWKNKKGKARINNLKEAGL